MDGVGIFRRMPLRERGGTKKSPEVAQAFKALYVYPSYRYYFLKSGKRPYGVAGLESATGSMTRRGGRLIPVGGFKKVVGLVQSFPVPGSYTEGYTIHDPQGMQIGVWYSSLGAGIHRRPEYQKGFDNNRDALVVEMRLQEKHRIQRGKAIAGLKLPA